MVGSSFSIAWKFLFSLTISWFISPLYSCAQFYTTLNVPPDPDIRDYYSIYSNTQVNLGEGGNIGFNVSAGSATGTNKNIEINIFGGTVGSRFTAQQNSAVNISGGTIGEFFSAKDGSMVDISEGTIGRGFKAYSGSAIDISGGSFYHPIVFDDGSDVTLAGGNFRLDGTLIYQLDPTGTTRMINVPQGSLLSGVLADGTPFAMTYFVYDSIADGTLTLLKTQIPDASPAIFNLPGEPAPSALRTGQKLVVGVGGVVGDHLVAEYGSEVTVDGGEIGGSFEVVGTNVTVKDGTIGSLWKALSGSNVNISNSVIGDAFRVGNGATVSMASGTLGRSSYTELGSVISVSAGTVGDNFNVGGVANISGGTFGVGFRPHEGSQVEISGGDFGEYFNADGGSNVRISGGTFDDNMWVREDSNVTLVGGEFQRNGIPVGGLLSAGDKVMLNSPGILLSGTLADGTPIILSGWDEDELGGSNISLEAAPLPPLGATFITAPYDPVPNGLRGGQALRVEVGGIVGKGFSCLPGSAVEVLGGVIGNNFEAVGAQITMRAGSIGDNFDVFNGTTFEIAGGSVGTYFSATPGSTVNMSGGRIGDLFSVYGGGPDTRVNIAGGTIGDSFSVITNRSDTKVVEIAGNDFRLNGVPITGLEALGSSSAVDLSNVSYLTGTLADGTPFYFSPQDRDGVGNVPGDYFDLGTLYLKTVELPALGPSAIVASTNLVPLGIRSGQTLIVDDGAIVDKDFNAGVGSRVQVIGGQVKENFEAVGAHVILDGGSIGDRFDAIDGTTVDILGGSIGDNFDAYHNATVNLTDGSIGNNFEAYYGATVNVVNSSIGEDFKVYQGSSINIQGSTVGDGFTAYTGSVVNISGDGTIGSLYINGDCTGIVSGGSLGRVAAVDASEISVSNSILRDFSLLARSTGRISSGSVDFGAYLYSSSVLDFSGGEIGQTLSLDNSSTANVSGGMIAGGVQVKHESTFNLSGGIVEGDVQVRFGSTYNLSGGTIGGQTVLEYASTANISGGSIGEILKAYNESTINLFGIQFSLNGTDITSSLQENVPLDISEEPIWAVAGVLADGSSFSLNLSGSCGTLCSRLYSGSILTITLVGPGDFNGDGCVDGADYLKWQRGESPNPLSSEDLAAWQANYGNGSMAEIPHAVPEPALLPWATLLGLMAVASRKKRWHDAF